MSSPPAHVSEEDRALYLTSAAVLRTHADRTVPGAIVASLSIPWGNTRNDLGGYHLVWSRDLVESAGRARRARRRPDGPSHAGLPRRHRRSPTARGCRTSGSTGWRTGRASSSTRPPTRILLAGALRRGGAAEMHGMAGTDAAAFEHLLTEDALEHMIASAARFIARTGPVTGQDRWEEDGGLTPSTLAPVVAALVVAADHRPEPAATYLRELADDWNASIEDWTYARGTTLAQGARRRRPLRPDRVARGAGRSPASRRPCRCATGRPTRRRSRPTRWSARISWPSCASACGWPMTRASSRRSPSPTRSCGPRRRAGRSGSATAVTDTASTRTGAPSTAPGSAGAGRCWSASGATTSWRRGETRDRTSRRCAGWRLPAACCPSRSGTPRRSPPVAWRPAGPAGPRCRWPGLTRST